MRNADNDVDKHIQTVHVEYVHIHTTSGREGVVNKTCPYEFVGIVRKDEFQLCSKVLFVCPMSSLSVGISLVCN